MYMPVGPKTTELSTAASARRHQPIIQELMSKLPKKDQSSTPAAAKKSPIVLNKFDGVGLPVDWSHPEVVREEEWKGIRDHTREHRKKYGYPAIGRGSNTKKTKKRRPRRQRKSRRQRKTKRQRKPKRQRKSRN